MRKLNLSDWAVRHQPMVLFLILILAVGGSYSYLRLGCAEDPSFTIKVANVTAVWPGATAKDLQNQVADPIEKKVQDLPFFDHVQTDTRPSFMAMQVFFKDTTPPAQVPWLFYLLRKKLTDAHGDLPAGLVGPDVNDEFGDVDSVLYMVTGESADYGQLKKVVESMRQRLLDVPDVVKVNLYGVQAPRIFVEFSQARLANLGVIPQAIFDSLARQNDVVASGVFQTAADRAPVRVSGAMSGAVAVAATPVEANGRVFRLGDVAKVTSGFEDPPQELIRQRGKAALGVGVVMAKGGNLLTLGKNLDAAMQGIRDALPVGIDIEKVADQPKVVEHAVGEFTRSFIEALTIVLFVSLLSLGLRTGIVVATAVPLVLAIVFIVMFAIGLDLQRITLGALIIALGLQVDDAIISVETMAVRMEQGFSRSKAATAAWDTTAFPMLSGTLVTAAGFLPVGFAASSAGEYAGGIFWVVSIALLASWLVAVLFTPLLGVKLLPDFGAGAGNTDPHAIYETRPYRALRRAISWSVDHRGLVVSGVLGLMATAVMFFATVPQQFFPISERPELFFQIRMPEGSAIGATLATAEKAEKMLQGDADIATYTTYVGQGSPRFWLGLNPHLPDEAYAEIVIVAKNLKARERVKQKIESAVSEGALAEARVRVDRFNFGPPVGFPVQFRVMGQDVQGVRDIAYRVRDIMRGEPDLREPQLDWNELMPSVRLVVDQDRARALGLTPQDVASSLQMLISGATVTTVRDGIEKVAVVARAAPDERADLGHLADLTILSRNGAPVPVAQVAKVVYDHEDAILRRRNRDVTITVRSDLVDGVQPPDVSNRIWARLRDLRASLPPGYRLEMGGAIEESAKGNNSLFAVFPVMILAMLTIVMAQLQNFARLGLVMMSAPLGIIGATVGLKIFGAPFGFVALLGMIALSGMDMRNSIILVDQVRQDLERGANYREAIIEATVRRARPVVLTALAAILAMVPLSRSLFWGPMAVTIMGGLFVATFLTILYLPALYALWFRRRLGESAPKPAAETDRPYAPAGILEGIG
ncbi:efflux RND transporter permease subunit [Rhodoblastus sp. 17X3]|uniref:efflux RND transporter permease subunit n=1 Tax=Rhodoblastus sp. 17X3 TaxID=3047026 RepID=UPI0024B70F11|nr:efflux RND transporter permease subunit [Rhodoblastus sp. 17X3]MDI9847838.1 efflux RND transporter permease subunit [Rhodoblastus sp. 17X3]